MTVASRPAALDRALEQIDAIADRLFAGWHVPGVAYGVTLGGRLVHSRGLGTLRVGEDAHAGCAIGLPDRLDDQELHRRRRPSLRDEGRLGWTTGSSLRPGAREPSLPHRRLAADHDPAPAHDDRRLPDR